MTVPRVGKVVISLRKRPLQRERCSYAETRCPSHPPALRELFADRLRQARALRRWSSQRASGLLMGLDKNVASDGVNCYEGQAWGIGLDGPGKLAEVLRAPVAYVVAEDEATASVPVCVWSSCLLKNAQRSSPPSSRP